MKIRILVENNPSPVYPSIKAEHGLSVLIENEDMTYLLDVGATGLWAANASAMGIDVTSIDRLILSHGHIDHTGGLSAFLRLNGTATVMASSMIKRYHYTSYRNPDSVHDLTPDAMALRNAEGRIRYVDNDCMAGDKVHLVFNKYSEYSFPCGDRFLKVTDTEGMERRYAADDEIAVAIESGDGIVIISSCSHCGMLNIIKSCVEATGINNVIAYVGGLHLLDSEAEKDNVEGIVKIVRTEYPAMRLYAGHCTGQSAKVTLSAELGDKFMPLCSGMEIEF